MRSAFALVLVLFLPVVVARRAQADHAFEDARAAGHLLADDDLVADRGLWTAPLDGGAVGLSLLGALCRVDDEREGAWRVRVDLVLQLPFERWLGRRPRTPPLLRGPREDLPMNDRTSMRDRAAAAAWLGALALSPAATGKTSPPTASSASPSALPRASAVPSTAAIPGPSASSTAAPQPAPDGPRRLTPATIHALLAAALRQAGLERDDALDALAARARWSGLVPEVRLRALRSADSGVRLYRTDEAADRWSGSDGASSLFEGRLTFRLDRFVFDEQEIALERVRVERVELRQRLTHRIVELAMRWTRARRLELDVDALPREREEALATELETLVGLDALTGGLASRLLAATATLTVTP